MRHCKIQPTKEEADFLGKHLFKPVHGSERYRFNGYTARAWVARPRRGVRIRLERWIADDSWRYEYDHWRGYLEIDCYCIEVRGMRLADTIQVAFERVLGMAKTIEDSTPFLEIMDFYAKSRGEA